MLDRRQFMIDYVRRNGFATPTDLAELTSVSPATVRRDLEKLDAEGVLCKVHGGVIYQRPAEPKSVNIRSAQSVDEKRRIARYVAKNIVVPGDKIMLDAGSTTTFIADELRSVHDITVISHSIEILNLLRDSSGDALVGVGGEYDSRLQAFVGPLAEEAYGELRADKAFIGSNALDLRVGCYDNTGTEKHIKTLMNRNARLGYVVVDSSKFRDDSGLFLSLEIAEIAHVITTLPKDSELLRENVPDHIEFVFVP